MGCDRLVGFTCCLSKAEYDEELLFLINSWIARERSKNGGVLK